MSVSNEMLGLTLAIILLYMTMYFHKIRIWRIVGCGLIICGSLTFAVVGDNITMWVIFLINLTVAGLKLISDISVATSMNPNQKGWF